MNELLPGLRHWRTHNPDIDYDVDCYWATSAGVSYVLDPLAPKEGLAVFDGEEAPQYVYMTNRLHDRSCAEFAERFGAPIWCRARACTSTPTAASRSGRTTPATCTAASVPSTSASSVRTRWPWCCRSIPVSWL